MESFSADEQSKTTYRNVHYLLIRAYLREERLADACTALFGIMRAFPQEAGAPVLLAYLGCVCVKPEVTGVFSAYALELGPEYRRILEKSAPVILSTAAAHPTAGVGDLLRECLAWQDALPECLRGLPETTRREAAQQAAALLDNLTEQEGPGAKSGAFHEDVRRLMPALIESSMRQALATGQAELVDTLRSLHITLTGQNRRAWEDWQRDG